MGSLPNLHELGREEDSAHHRPGPALGRHCGPAHSSQQQQQPRGAAHRHSAHCRVTKARSNGHGSRIVYDDFMLEVGGA